MSTRIMLRDRPGPRTTTTLLIAAALLALAGCNGSSTGASGGGTPAVTISGASQTHIGTPVQLTAAVTNTSNTAVTWQVNNVTGGAAATGTISTTGLYTPPATLPTTNTVTITAVSTATATPGTLSETILNPIATVSAATATQSGITTTYALDIIGTNFLTGAQVQVGGTSITTTFVSSTELQATTTAPAGATSLAIDVLNPSSGSTGSPTVNAALSNYKTTLPSAARLLDQATFGPTLTDIQHVQQVGIDAYITEQFAVPNFAA